MMKQLFRRFKRKKTNAAAPSPSPDTTRPVDAVSDSAPDRDGGNSPSVVPLRSAGYPLAPRKKDSAEVFQEAVDKLVEKLEGINDNLASQVRQNERLVERMDALPRAAQAQQAAFAQVAEQLRDKVARDEKVAEHLGGIHDKVAAAAEVDAKMCESFGAFAETLSKLDTDTVSQTEWLQQMSRTFTDGERYLKATVERQQRRFYWVLGISLGICVLALAGLIVGIFLLAGPAGP